MPSELSNALQQMQQAIDSSEILMGGYIIAEKKRPRNDA